MEDEEQEEVERVRVWVGRLQVFAESLDNLEGTSPSEFCESACLAWQSTVVSDSPPPASPASLIIIQAAGAMTQVMKTVALDWVDTADVRDRLTREGAQQLLKDSLQGIVSDSERWISEGLPSAEEVQQRIAAAGKGVQAAMGELERRNAELEQAELDAAADPYGAVWGSTTQTGTLTSTSRSCARSPSPNTSAIEMRTNGYGKWSTVSCCDTSPMKAML